MIIECDCSIFQDEGSVQQLIDACIQDEDKLYLCVSSPTIKDKPVQIRPWRLSDADFVLDASMPLDPRKTVFVGGVPRPLKAVELAMIMDRLYGGVCYAGIDTDPELKYPKGAGRVAFSNQQSYIAAISARFVQLQHGDIDKRVSTKKNCTLSHVLSERDQTSTSSKKNYILQIIRRVIIFILIPRVFRILFDTSMIFWTGRS